MQHHRKRIGLACAASAFWVACFSTHAAATSDDEAGLRINLAGYQRALTQIVAKSACFAHVQADNSDHLAEMSRSAEEFEATYAGFLEGSDSLGLTAELSAVVITAIEEAKRAWAPMKAAIANIEATGTVSRADLQALATNANIAFAKANATVDAMVASYATDGDVETARAKTINAAGAQRSRAQRSAKDFCMIAARIDVAAHREELRATVARFDQVLSDLKSGENGLETPGPRIAEELERVGVIWRKLTPELDGVLAGGTPDQGVIGVVAVQSNRVLREMNRAVYRYTITD
ncbi:MAG: type IV pili methyl-accepting chemotaxis transducer N-terminal domain-containing protein [Pseudomonadota bacterium]